jgi:hypothetical protein
MSDLKLTPSLLSMLERIEKHSGTLLMLAVTASGGQDGKLNKLRGAGYVVKCDHPSVTEGAWPAEALAITEAGRAALEKHRAEAAEKKGRQRSRDKRVIFRRDGDRYIVFLGDDRIGFVRRAITELGTTSRPIWFVEGILAAGGVHDPRSARSSPPVKPVLGTRRRGKSGNHAGSGNGGDSQIANSGRRRNGCGTEPIR